MIAPEAPATSGGTPSPENDDPKKSSRLKKIAWTVIGSVVGTGVIVTGAVVGVNLSNKHEVPAGNEPVATGKATPSPENTKPPVATEVQATPISAEKYTTPEAVVKASVGEVDEWINAGGTEANSKAWASSDDPGAYFTNLMTKSNAQFESQLLVDNWQTIPSLSTYVPNKENIHKTTTNLNFLTTPNDPNSEYNSQNKEAYKRGEVVDSIQFVSEDSTKIVADVTVHEYDNSDKNAVLKYTEGVAIDTTPYTIRMTMTNVNGNWKLSDYSE
ncbi:MAG: hypothetical protein JWN12_465 [Candidatus Saccharibacteria bacterium]|nr:hypothetical protein [Candidatus Saccharibacteria bacterium]